MAPITAKYFCTKFLQPLGANLLTHKTTEEGGSERGAPAYLRTGRELSVYKYNHSEKRLIAQRRYQASAKGRATGIRYKRSPAGEIMRKLFARLPATRLRQRLNAQAKQCG